MSSLSKAFKECRQKRRDTFDIDYKKRIAVITKEAEKEAKKSDPFEIRRVTAMDLVKGIDLDKKEAYELLYDKIEKRANTLYDLIIHDLGLDEDENAPLSPCTIYNIINYYENKGLNQLKDAASEEVMKYNPGKLSPHNKLFKNLIAKRAEFLIVAPKDRLSLNAPYTKIKDEETQIALIKHLEELNLLPSYKFAEKFPKLNNLYLELKENNLEL